MSKKLQVLSIVSAAFVLGMTINNFAMSDMPANFKVATVNVPAVVEASSEVQALKQEQNQKLQELQKWLDLARADVAKQQTQEGKEKLLKKYDNEFAKKQDAIKANYAKKLQSIDKNISKAIATTAKEEGYDLVLARISVLYGGNDITKSIKAKVK